MSNEVLIVGASRSATGRRSGTLSYTHPLKVAAPVIRQELDRSGVPLDEVDFVVGGCITQSGEQSFNIARTVSLAADLPIEVPSVTLDFQCGSSQQALQMATDMVRAGTADLVVAMGVENMTRVPMGQNWLNTGGKPFTKDLVKEFGLTQQGIAGDNIAVEYGITRDKADEFGARSHQRAGHAQATGLFEDEIIPLVVEKDGQEVQFSEDETIRPETTPETLSTLEPAFRADGIHHAGNSSQISDQAPCVILASEKKAQELGLKSRARIVAHASVGSDPHLMLTGPITATPKVLERAGLSLHQMDSVEINEAFASVVLAWAKTLEPNMEKVNPNGGAIALGHALGSTGTLLMTTLLHHLERTDGRYGLETMCCGGGLATATVIERLN